MDLLTAAEKHKKAFKKLGPAVRFGSIALDRLEPLSNKSHDLLRERSLAQAAELACLALHRQLATDEDSDTLQVHLKRTKNQGSPYAFSRMIGALIEQKFQDANLAFDAISTEEASSVWTKTGYRNPPFQEWGDHITLIFQRADQATVYTLQQPTSERLKRAA